MNRKKRKGYQEYVRRSYGWSFPVVRELWAKAEREYSPTSHRAAGLLRELGFKQTVSDQFFQLAAGKMNDESDAYYCINGCCVVLWHPVRGNHGGWGPAGCSCDNLDDPRGPEPKLIPVK